mmetsp:Transcript_25574/g.19347  ORF Transcript_25574/g.19347 Transcript_25574/m.19347 type:complete len:150 (+) Transcript_25574:3386-3835(+)
MSEFYNKARVGGLSAYSAGSIGAGMGMMPTALSSGKMMFMSHFNNLNTIEEEKHETQTSNYFKEGESDDSKMLQNQSCNVKGSRILADINKEIDKSSPATNKTTSIAKGSPLISRRDPDYNFKNSNTKKEEEYEENFEHDEHDDHDEHD